MRPQDHARKILSNMTGGSDDAGFNNSDDIFVEGIANQKSTQMYIFDSKLLSISIHPFAAFQTHYIYATKQEIYQRKFANLIVEDSRSRPDTNLVDFSHLARILSIFFNKYINVEQTKKQDDLSDISLMLDQIFIENEKIRLAANQHHKRKLPYDITLNFSPPVLTRYDRLISNGTNQPEIETLYALLHYEKSIREFNQLIKLNIEHNQDSIFIHGVYCIVSIAACIEAIANNLEKLSQLGKPTTAYPKGRKNRLPIETINDSAEKLALSHSSQFTPISSTDPIYNDIEKIRLLRNFFIHSQDTIDSISPTTLTSEKMEMVSAQNCRNYLKQTRLFIKTIFDQIPFIKSPIITNDNYKWLGEEIEIP
jgi:hypothetical protein